MLNCLVENIHQETDSNNNSTNFIFSQRILAGNLRDYYRDIFYQITECISCDIFTETTYYYSEVIQNVYSIHSFFLNETYKTGRDLKVPLQFLTACESFSKIFKYL